MTTRADMLFIVEMSVRYHRRRASFLDLASALMTLVTVIGGAGAFLSLLGEGTIVAKFATLILAIVGLVQAVFRVDTCAAQHRQWLKSWLDMLYELRTTEEPTEAKIDGWVKRRYAIESDCVSELRALQADCYNRTMAALNRAGEPYPIQWWHRALMQVWSFEEAFPG